MNLEPTPEQSTLGESVRQALASVPEHDDTPSDPAADPVRKALVGLGMAGMLVPAQHGGHAASMADVGVVLDELGRRLTPGPWLSTVVAAPRALTRLGLIQGEGARLLSELAEGSTTATVGFEPTHGTVIPPLPHSDIAVLNGCASAVPDADAVDLLLVIAGAGPNRALLAIDTAAPGVTIDRLATIDPTRPQFRVHFTDTPARNLGSASDDAVAALIDDVLIAAAADAVGAAQRVLDLTLDHAKVRTQFGRPVGSFQAVQHLCVDMYETVELARSGVMHGLWAADAASPAERHLAAIRAKAFSGQLATVGDAAVQVFGGIGFTWEHPAHRYLKRLLNWSTFLGNPDRYLQEIGTRLAHGECVR